MTNQKPTVNLKNLKAGDTVHFRCGGSAEVIEQLGLLGTDYVRLYFTDQGSPMTYFLNGSYDFNIGHPLDIIKITPKAFDWADAKPGMAFKHNEGSKGFYFVAHDPSNKDCAIFSTAYSPVLGFKEIDFMPYNLLSIRAPEHDIMITEEEEEGG